MQRYVIERHVRRAGELSREELQSIARRLNHVLREMTAFGAAIQWEHSYVTGNRIYCVYLAETEQTIREHANRCGFSCKRVSAVALVIGPLTETSDGA